MKQAELARYRAMLQSQAVEAPRRSVFPARPQMTVVAVPGRPPALSTPVGPPPRRVESLFGRRAPEAVTQPPEAMVLESPVAEAAPLVRRGPLSAELAETPYHAEDLADPPPVSGPSPGIIAGWSSAKPPSAQVRLLRRLAAVVEAERQGLASRLEAVGVEAA